MNELTNLRLIGEHTALGVAEWEVVDYLSCTHLPIKVLHKFVFYFWYKIQGISKKGNVDYFTDVSKYTGTHKERFDEQGKGKGKAGREDVVDKSGYVTGFQKEGKFTLKFEFCSMFANKYQGF